MVKCWKRNERLSTNIKVYVKCIGVHFVCMLLYKFRTRGNGTRKRRMMISGKYRKFGLEKAPPGREPVIPATESWGRRTSRSGPTYTTLVRLCQNKPNGKKKKTFQCTQGFFFFKWVCIWKSNSNIEITA